MTFYCSDHAVNIEIFVPFERKQTEICISMDKNYQYCGGSCQPLCQDLQKIPYSNIHIVTFIT